MPSAAQSSNVVATRYVTALIELAEDSKGLDKVEIDFQDLGKMIESSEDFRHLIRSPLIPAEKQLASINAIAKKAKLQDLTVNFLRVLVQNRRLNMLESTVTAFSSALAERRGALEVVVETAQDLSAKQVKALQDALKKGTGADISLKAKVEPGILGGMIVTVGSHMIDDSVRRKLERLKLVIGTQSNENANSKLSEVS